MRERPALLPRAPVGVLLGILLAGGVTAILRHNVWIGGVLLGLAVLRVLLWVIAPYARWAWEAIDPGPQTLKRMNRQADALEQSRIPGLGALARTANRGQWWRRPDDRK